MNQYGQSNVEKLNSDWLLIAGAMTSPTDVNFFSRGLCGHVPFIENLVDFEKLKTAIPHTLTAYCIEKEEVEEFDKPNVGVHEFRAALSFPFIYPPYRIGDKHYYEGAAVESLNLVSVMEEFRGKVDQIIVFDVLTKDLIHRPRNLMDAYAQSIIVPLVANAEKELAIFEYWAETGCPILPLTVPKDPGHRLRELLNKLGPDTKTCVPPGIEVLKVRFDIPDDRQPYLLDWSKIKPRKLVQYRLRGRTEISPETRREPKSDGPCGRCSSRTAVRQGGVSRHRVRRRAGPAHFNLWN